MNKNSQSNDSQPDKNSFHKLIKKCRQEDFDGHTEFSKLNPSQRLDWLNSAIQSYAELKNYKYKITPRKQTKTSKD